MTVDATAPYTSSVIYLDNNATTRPLPEVVQVMERALREHWANPSSMHRAGQLVRQQIDLAREQVAQLIGCADRELIVTSGGTESINLALKGTLQTFNSPGRKPAANARPPHALVTDKLEHSAVRDTVEHLARAGNEVIWLESDADGVINLDALRKLLKARAQDIALVSIMWANNETGVMQPLEDIGNICRKHNVRLHVDGTQMMGKEPINVAELPIDLMSFAAHKFHGPKGVGGLYLARGVKIQAQITGGPQEREKRGGTENVPGILGTGEAARLARQWLATNVRTTLAVSRTRFEQAILNAIPDATVNGAGAQRLWNTTNIAFPGLEAEALLLMLSERGVCASAGAACSSGSLDPSPVLLAMGVPEERVHGSIRFSISRETTDDELDQAADIIIATVQRLTRAISTP